eukprot:135342_1
MESELCQDIINARYMVKYSNPYVKNDKPKSFSDIDKIYQFHEVNSFMIELPNQIVNINDKYEYHIYVSPQYYSGFYLITNVTLTYDTRTRVIAEKEKRTDRKST